MRSFMTVLIVAALVGSVVVVRAETGSAKAPGSQLTIIPTSIGNPEVIKINTGKKAQMTDGKEYTVYDTVRPKEGNTFVEIKVDMATDPGPLRLDTSMIRLEGSGQGATATYVPVYWYLDSGLEPARADSLTIDSQAGLDFTFEVPTDRMDRLALWIAGLRVASIPEIRDRLLQQQKGE
jgi:hypothetical protein